MHKGAKNFRKKFKNPHTHTILIKVYDLHLLGSSFWLSNIMWGKYASLSYLPKTPQKAFRSSMKRRQISKAFGEDNTHSVIEWIILRSKVKFHVFKIKQNPSFWAKCSEGIWILTVPLFNHSRFYGRHSECSQVKVKLGITCMQISYQGDDLS
jgi:hypothetical protein